MAFYTGGKFRDLVEAEGAAHFSFSANLERQLDSLVFSSDGMSTGGLRRPMQLESQLRGFYVGTIPSQIDDLDVVLAEWAPDVVVSDCSLWGPILVLQEARQIPVALLSPYIACWLPGSDVPPLGLGLPPPNSWRRRFLTQLGNTALKAFRFRISRDINLLRQQYGLSSIDTSAAAYMSKSPLHIVPSSPEFDYERQDLPSTVHYVGHCPWYPPHQRDFWIDELPQDRPIVHVSEGTLNFQEPVILRAAAQGLADLPAEVIMTTGRRDPNALGLGSLASNIRVEPWISYPDLLPKVSVVVTHGGAGTVMASLAEGVPMVVVPLKWDQPDNAQRVVEAGAGVRLSPGRCTPRRLREAVEHVLSEPRYRHGAQQLASSFNRLGGPAQAAELLESLTV